MISLQKLEMPNVLRENFDVWTKELMIHIENSLPVPNAVQGRYRHSEIKNQLVLETHGKCAYCESEILHIDYGDIEHIEPKSNFPAKTFDWSNMTLCCGVCNTNKAAYYDSENPLLNPYTDTPESELIFAGPVCAPRAGSYRGMVTLRKLKLNRPELVEKRRKHLELNLMPLLEAYSQTDKEDLKKLLYEDIVSRVAQNAEYSCMAAHFLQQVGILNMNETMQSTPVS